MSSTRAENTKLGIFTTAAIALALVVTAVFAGASILKSEDTYYINYNESVAGLTVGAPVRLRGVRVGSVRAIEINPDNVEEIRVTVGLKPKTPVKQDAKAVIGSVGLTGLQFIDLRHGTAESPRLAPGSTIASQTSLIGQLSDSARDISAKSYQIVDQVAELTRPENREQVDEIIKNANTLVKNLSETSKELNATLKVARRVMVKSEPDLVKTINNVGEASVHLDRLLIRADRTMAAVESELDKAKVGDLVVGLAQTNTMIQSRIAELDFAGTMESISKTLASVQRLLGQVVVTLYQNEEQIRATLFNLRQTSENVKELSRSLRNDPSRLIFDAQPKERQLPKR